MVSTPTGDAHAQVAANFAAALSRLGLKVALMAMSVDQDWYLEAFTLNRDGMVRLPELLERAHSGTLPAGWRDRLPVTEYAPNLVVVPPADEPMLHLPDRRPARAAAGALRRRRRRHRDRGPAAARRGRRDDRRVGDAQRLVGDHPRRGHPGRGACRGRSHGAGRSHAVRRGDGRAADHRSLTCGRGASRRCWSVLDRATASGARRPFTIGGDGPDGAPRRRSVVGRAIRGERARASRPPSNGGRRGTAPATGTTTRWRRRGRAVAPTAGSSTPRKFAAGRSRPSMPALRRRGGRVRRACCRARTSSPSPILTRVLVPVFGLLATIAAARWLSCAAPRRAVARQAAGARR